MAVADTARIYAQTKHGTVRRHDGLVIDHVKRVVSTLTDAGINDDTILSVAWLHDIIEDTHTNYDDILNKFGNTVADMVSSLSEDSRLPQHARESEYEQRLSMAPPQAKTVKLADVLVNLQSETHSDLDATLDRKASRLRRHLLAIQSGIRHDTSAIQNKIDAALKMRGLDPVFVR